MSFVNKFKPAGNPPPGVKMEFTSFGHAQNKTPYTVPTIPKQNVPAPKTQPRGGWDDDDDDEPQLRSGGGNSRGITVQTQNQGIAKKPFIQSPATSGSNKSDDLNLGPSRKTANPAKDYELMQINDQFLSSHDFENNTINNIIQPGGARVKQSDAVLNGFCKACESFQVPVVGTLLLSKLYEDLPFISKARTLYLIEIIVKKVKKYLEYFKYNLSTLQGADYSNEGSADQLIKITKDIVEYIQEPNKPKPQPSFPTNLTHYSNPTPVQQTSNLLGGGDDLLGSPEAKTSKPDPFGFVKKPTTETTKAQAPTNRPAATQPQQNNNQLLDLDFGSAPSQPQQSFTQPISQPQTQAQAQPKKFNPFEIPTQSQQPKPQPQPVIQAQPQPQPQTQNTAKPSGLPGNFKKFQGASSAQESTPTQQANKPITPVNQGSRLDKMDDLLSSLDFSSASTQPTTFSQPPTNTFSTAPQTSGSGIKSSFPPTQAPTTQPSFTQPSQPPTSFGNTSNQGFNSGLNANKFPQPNVPGPQMNAPYGNMGPGYMGSGPTGYGYNAGPGYGQGPSGFNAPQGNWNTAYPSAGGYGGFNPQGGHGYGGYGQQQQQQYPIGGYGQGQNFGGNNNFQQGYNCMGGGFQNQGRNSYYNQPGSPELGGGLSLGLYSAEAIANQEEIKKRQEKAKNEALFDNLKF